MSVTFQRLSGLYNALINSEYLLALLNLDKISTLSKAAGRPRFFTVVGGEFVFDRVPDSEYTIQVQYYRKPAVMTTDSSCPEGLPSHLAKTLLKLNCIYFVIYNFCNECCN